MRNPNGYGGISKLPGNRRKPWRARLTDGWDIDEEGHTRQRYKTLGYYETREAAMLALAEYNANPYKLDHDITFAEVYERWSTEKYPTISVSNVHGYKASYAVCGDLWPMKFREIKRNHLQTVVDTCGKNYPSLRKLRVLFSQLFTYAIQNDICDKDYSDFIDIAKHKDPDAEGLHKPFSRDELAVISENAPRSKWISIILIMIYSGVRIGELLAIKKADVHIDEHYADIRKAKTAAGVRKIPIADAVMPYWKTLMEEPGEYLIHYSAETKADYNTYLRVYFLKPLEQIGIKDHLPHDTRHTCISLLTAAGVDRILIKRIVGHQGEDVTDKVYTHYDVEQLVTAINKIDGVI